MYYINDGVHGSFSFVLFDKNFISASTMQFVFHQKPDTGIVHSSSIWGPTCDGLDCVLEDCQLPELNVGDWLYFDNMGAYSFVFRSTFNGMSRPRFFYYCQADIWYELYPETACKVEHGDCPEIMAGRELPETADADIEDKELSQIEI
ncbi:hypothetical protein ScPMuIL_005414 [Solemya velum]